MNVEEISVPRDILLHIQNNMAAFSKGQKRIAAFILQSYDKAAFMTASKLGKTTDARMAMLRQQTTDLLEHGQMRTTVTRAKEIAPLAEKMITLAKQNDLAA